VKQTPLNLIDKGHAALWLFYMPITKLAGATEKITYS